MNKTANMNTNKIFWPDIRFGPVSLWSLPPAWWFYSSKEEKEEFAKNLYFSQIST